MLRSLNIWGPGYLAARLRRPRRRENVTCHLMLAIADHFEPLRGATEPHAARKMVRDWLADYRTALSPFRDADGRRPQHTFFFPGDAYDHECVDQLAEFAARRLGETEIHFHHRNDTAANLTARLREYRDCLHREHGLLGCDRSGNPRFGFVHGNWALCNSRPDGDWCGVCAELSLLSGLGCYADFTFPSAPSPTQPRTVNTIYRAADRPDGRPRAHDYGRAVRVGNSPTANPGSLLMIPGPLVPRRRPPKWGFLPRLENAELSGVNPPDPLRIHSWLAPHIHVSGRPEWVFVKLHTHGCVPANRDALLGAPMRELHRKLTTDYNDGRRWQLHYVTARELANLVRAAEDGAAGNPGDWRDYAIRPPPCAATPALDF